VSNSQLTYDLDYAEQRSRLTTFFRLLLVIPVEIFVYFYLLLAYLVSIVAWFVLLFTARYPQGLYDFIGGALRAYGRVTAYAFLGTDAYPPFSGGEHPEYPVRIGIGVPLEKYSRLKVFFVGLYALPVMIIAYALNIVASLCAFGAWFVIVVTGKQPAGLQDALKFGLSYVTRAPGVVLMLKQSYPSISAEAAEAGAGGGAPMGGPGAAGGPEAPSIGI
jgi:hypothetical protein